MDGMNKWWLLSLKHPSLNPSAAAMLVCIDGEMQDLTPRFPSMVPPSPISGYACTMHLRLLKKVLPISPTLIFQSGLKISISQ